MVFALAGDSTITSLFAIILFALLLTLRIVCDGFRRNAELSIGIGGARCQADWGMFQERGRVRRVRMYRPTTRIGAVNVWATALGSPMAVRRRRANRVSIIAGTCN